MQFGLTLPQRGILFDVLQVDDLVRMARDADADPLFESVWVGDSLFAKPRPESIALLGVLAGVTSRVTLGVGCMASFPVRDPLIFALQWGSLDLLSHGRMLLAACTGIIRRWDASALEGRNWGVEDSERARRMEENIELCRRLWSGEQASFDGTFVQFADVVMAPAPVQQPCPIWIAANPPEPDADRPEATNGPLRRVARVADGWMTVQNYPDAFKSRWEVLQGLLVEQGRDPESYPNIAYHNININEDAEAGYEESKRFLDAYYGPAFDERAVRSWTALGSPERCIEQLRSLKEAGAKSVTLRITSWDQVSQYKRLVEEVLPHV